MVKPLNKGTKARLRRVAQAADKAADFLTKAHGETYNLPQYQEMIRNCLDLVLQVHALATKDAKATDPDNPPVTKPTKPKDEEQTDLEDFTEPNLDAEGRIRRG